MFVGYVLCGACVPCPDLPYHQLQTPKDRTPFVLTTARPGWGEFCTALGHMSSGPAPEKSGSQAAKHKASTEMAVGWL